MDTFIPTPALGFIGRKNSGKTTLLEKLITELTNRGLKVATVKHHGHPDFDIDIPGRDSYRHRMAGAQSTTILSNVRFACVTELKTPVSCEEVLSHISHYDITLVEGFKTANIPHIELFRKDNARDEEVVDLTINAWQIAARNKHIPTKQLPIAVVTNITQIKNAAENLNIPWFDYEDIAPLASFIQTTFARPRLSVVVQAGGESKRMGKPKETVSFLGKPLIEHVLSRVAPLADELIVTTNDPHRLEFLKQHYPNIRLEKDIFPQRGAVPGLLTALSTAHNELVALVACDMVDIPAALLAEEALLMRPCITPTYEAILPKTETGIEPFAAIYRRESCLKAVTCLMKIHEKQPCMRDVLNTLQDGYIDCTHPVKRARWQGSFLNINTPEELHAAEDAFLKRSDCIL